MHAHMQVKHTHMHPHITHTYMHACAHTHTHSHIHTLTHTNTHTRARTHTHTNKQTNKNTHKTYRHSNIGIFIVLWVYSDSALKSVEHSYHSNIRYRCFIVKTAKNT